MNNKSHAELRIDMLEKIKKDKNKIRVKDVSEIFAGIMNVYFEHTKTGQMFKKKLTKDEYIKFLHGFSNSFLSTLYVNGAKDKKEFEERNKFVHEVNADLLAYAGEADKL